MMTNTPSNAEIEKLAAEHIKAFAQFTGAGGVLVEGEVAFARAVLAKWGSPQPVVREPLTPDQVTAAAKKLAECMDYPWDYMSYPGQAEMRKHAQAVVEAAQGITQKGCGEC